MPCIVSRAVADSKAKGINIVLAGSPELDAEQENQIVVFVRTMEFDEFFGRFTPETVEKLRSGDFVEATKKFPVDVQFTDEVLDLSGETEKIGSAELQMVTEFAPMMSNLHTINLSGCGVGPKEAGWFGEALGVMASIKVVNLSGCGLAGAPMTANMGDGG